MGRGSARMVSVIAVIALMTGVAWRANGASSASETSAKPGAVVDPAEAEGVIFERQQLMLDIERESKVLGEVVAGTAPADKLAPSARAIATLARESIAAFGPQAPGGRAKPEVWTNWPDYSQRMAAFADKSEEMAKQAEAGNMEGVLSLMTDALPCKQCHDVYRNPKKPTP